MAKLSRAYDTELMQKSGTRLDGRPAAVYSGPPQHDTSPSKPCGIAHRSGWMWQAICVAPSASKSRCSANPASTSTIRTRNTPSVPSPATSAVCTCDQSCVPPSNTSHRTRRRDRHLKGMGDSDGDAGVEGKSTDLCTPSHTRAVNDQTTIRTCCHPVRRQGHLARVDRNQCRRWQSRSTHADGWGDKTERADVRLPWSAT